MIRNRRVVTLLLVALAMIVVASGVLTYVLLKGPNGPFGKRGGSPTANLPQTPIGLTPVANKGCGITKTNNGYAFSWLHVTNGAILSNTNCVVTLKGFNWSQIEFGNAVGGGARTRLTDQSLGWFNNNFHMNAFRVLINVNWWNNNVLVPISGIRYRDWIQQIVTLGKKYGDYVLFAKGPQFHNLPCTGAIIADCPSQNQGVANAAQNPIYSNEETSGRNITEAVKMWTSVAKIYAAEPAVLYDSWNEMHSIPANIWYQSENALVNTIRGQNTRSLIFIGGPQYNTEFNILLRSKTPDLPQGNLVYDFHVYNGFVGPYNGKRCEEPLSYFWDAWPNNANEQTNYLQGHLRRAVSIGEWGGCNDVAIYNNAMTSYAHSHNISMFYYDETNVFNYVNSVRILNENGVKVQAAYGAF